MKIFKIILGILLVIMALFGFTYLVDNAKPMAWEITNTSNKNGISWARFEWTNGVISGKPFKRTSISIPCKIKELPNVFTFQFDLGARYTGIYENSFSSFYATNPSIKQINKRMKSPIQFWNKGKIYENLSIYFGDYKAYNSLSYVYGNFGEKIEINSKNVNDTIHLGTIGADLFYDKVLIIDYPNERFAICEQVPDVYKNNLIDIKITNKGYIILPMKIRNNLYEILFDTGSSIFPIITKAKNINNYSTLPDTDTIKISSWGKMHDVTGRIIKDTFELAGQKFTNVKVYANHSGLGIDNQTDGMTGNALFWDKTVIIDFKNKKFGVK